MGQLRSRKGHGGWIAVRVVGLADAAASGTSTSQVLNLAPANPLINLDFDNQSVCAPALHAWLDRGKRRGCAAGLDLWISAVRTDHGLRVDINARPKDSAGSRAGERL
jgi:hypothetical protein